jgi:hypothetical protein
MVMEKAFGWDSPLQQGAPDLATMTAEAYSMFRGKAIRPLGFSCRGEYIGKRAASGGGLAGLTPWWRGLGVGHATLGCGWLLAPLRLIFGLCDASEKIEGLALFRPILKIFPV